MITVVGRTAKEKASSEQEEQSFKVTQACFVSMGSLSRMIFFPHEGKTHAELKTQFSDWVAYFTDGDGKNLLDHQITCEKLLTDVEFPNTNLRLRHFQPLSVARMHCQLGELALRWSSTRRDFRDLCETIHRICAFNFGLPPKDRQFYQGVHFITATSQLGVAAAVINDKMLVWVMGAHLKVANKEQPNLRIGQDMETGKCWVFKKTCPGKVTSVERELKVLETCYSLIYETSKKEGIEPRYPFPMNEIISLKSANEKDQNEKDQMERTLAFEHYAHGDLYAYLSSRDPLPLLPRVELCKEIFWHIWEPIAKRGITHRDIKLENIICIHVEDNGMPRCRAIDWGAGQIRGEDPSTAKKTFDYTPNYMTEDDYNAYASLNREGCWEEWWQLCEQHEAFTFGYVFYLVCISLVGAPFHLYQRPMIDRNGNQKLFLFPDTSRGMCEKLLSECLHGYAGKSQLIRLIRNLLNPDRVLRATFEEALKTFYDLP